MLKIVLIIVLASLCSPVLAQSAKDMEESAFILCSDRLGTATEAEACTDWIVEGVCRSTYLSRIEHIAKLTSHENLLKYRVAAESQLPRTCEPMSAVILNLDILKGIPVDDVKARLKRWERAFYWSTHLAPQQRQILAAEAAEAPEFGQILDHAAIKPQIQKAAAESAGLLPDISEQTLFFLHQLEDIRPDWMTPETHAVLLSDELNKSQYKMASSRLNQIDITKLSEDHKKRLIPIIANAAVQLFGKADLSQAVCFRESPAKDLTFSKLALLESLDVAKTKGLIAGHLMTMWLMRCDVDAIGKRLADLWLNHPADPNLYALTNSLLNNLETHRDVYLGISIAKYMEKLDNKTLVNFQKQYASRLFAPLFDAALFALNTSHYDLARQALEAVTKFVPSARQDEYQFHLGRTYAALKDETKARQIWAQIIDRSPNSSWGMKAAYLSVLSFQKSGKKSEAQALIKQMETLSTENIWFHNFNL